MSTEDKRFEAASDIECGSVRSGVAIGLDEKSGSNGSSPTPWTNKELQHQQTSSSAISSLKKAGSWAASAGQALRPKTNKGRTRVDVLELESFPLGYPRLARYLDSDDAFCIYRRFGTLHARLLLQRQDELRELEEELAVADNADLRSEEGQLCLQCREDDENRTEEIKTRSKTQIFADIQEKLLEYGSIMNQAQSMVNMNTPHERDHRSVVNFMENRKPLVETEREWVYRKEDLVTLRQGRETAWLDAGIEAVLRWYPCSPIKKMFCTEEDRRKSTDPAIHYFSRSRINLVVTLAITFVILALLVVPIWGLFTLTLYHGASATDAACIGVLLVSTLVFSAVLSTFTKAKRHEVLAAAAAYCAVLVVFVGNVSNSNNGGGGGGISSGA